MLFVVLFLLFLFLLIWLIRLIFETISPGTIRSIVKGIVSALLVFASFIAIASGKLWLVLLLLPLFYFFFRNHIKALSLNDNQESMTLTKARQILGVSESADEQEILEAFRRLMLKNHPDHGGSDYIASQLVLARDLLLKHARKL